MRGTKDILRSEKGKKKIPLKARRPDSLRYEHVGGGGFVWGGVLVLGVWCVLAKEGLSQWVKKK